MSHRLCAPEQARSRSLTFVVHSSGSPVIVALGDGDNANKALADLGQMAVYQVAADAAKDCMGKAGAAWR